MLLHNCHSESRAVVARVRKSYDWQFISGLSRSIILSSCLEARAGIELSTVTVPGQSPTMYSYDEAGNLGGYTHPNGVATSYTYDKLNRLTDERNDQRDRRHVRLQTVGRVVGVRLNLSERQRALQFDF